MAEFLGDIAFALEALLLGAGLITLDIGRRQTSNLIKSGAYVFIAVGALGALCTGYFWFNYNSQGSFATAYPSAMSMHGNMHMGAGAQDQMGSNAMNRMMQGQMPMGSGDQMGGDMMDTDDMPMSSGSNGEE